MPYFRFSLIAFILICCHFSGHSQAPSDIIKLSNPGFNGTPKASSDYIGGWKDCGRTRFPGETPVDLQPGFFDVTLPPYEGQTYLGMVSRDNDTWESVTQQLIKPLKEGECYTFSIHLATSPKYKSGARGEGVAAEEAELFGYPIEYVQFVEPIVLKIWGSKEQCAPLELLAVTDKIKNHKWEKFDFRFEPKTELNFIMLEAYTDKVPTPFASNGHVLVDGLSDIVAIPCNMEPPVVKFVKPRKSDSTESDSYTIKATLANIFSKDDIEFKLNNKRFTDFKFDMVTGVLTAKLPLRKGANKVDLKGENGEGASQAAVVIRQKEEVEVVAVVPPPIKDTPSTPTRATDNTLEGVKREDLKKDLKLILKNITFDMNSSDIKKENERSLLNIGKFLTMNRDVVIEIGGHTNNRCADAYCNSLSENRAKAVLDFLVQNGVAEGQLKAKGYGSKEPIASNNSTAGRRRNQRVEIKILEAGG